MRGLRIIFFSTASLLFLGCADAPLNPGPSEPVHLEQAVVSGSTELSGTYEAVVDFSTLSLTPRGENCRLVVDGRLVFSGDVEGTATGTTSALVFAPCSEVATAPPGAFRDVFTSELRFVGTVEGEPAEADALYQGVTQAGGAIEGRVHFSNGVAGVLDVDAVVAVGGSYEGALVVP